MSWNCPQTLTEALESIKVGFSIQSHLGVKAAPIWVLTDVTNMFTKSDDFSNDLVRRNWSQKDRYMRDGRRFVSDDLVYVVARDGVALVGLLRNGTILTNDRELPKRLQTFRSRAVEALTEHVAAKGHLTRDE